MNERWSLEGLYRGFDDPTLQSDLTAAQAAVEGLTAFSAALEGPPVRVLEQAVNRLRELQELFEKLGVFASLTQAADARDQQAAALLGRLMAAQSAAAGPQTAIRQYVAGLPDLEAVIAQSPLLTQHAWLLQNIRADSRYLLDRQTEEALSLYENSGSTAWGDLQNYLTASVKVSYRGETTTLSAIRNRAYDPDPAVRRDAYDAELSCYGSIQDAVAFSLNSIKLEVLNRCRLRGYESPLQEAVYQARMKPETLEALLTAIREYLPKLWAYLRAKGRYLGHENGLPWYDLFAPMGGSDRTYTTAQARDYLTEVFGGFDPELSQMAGRAFDESWIDFYPRDGKSGGAFCCQVHSLAQSRILTNFDGAFGDVVTLAHELGHAFHAQQLFGNSILNTEYSMPLAETASTFNEILVMKTAIARETDPALRLALLESRLMDTTQIICDIYSRYLFEKSVFDSRDEAFLFPDRLCELMTQAQQTAYGNGLDPAALHPWMWVCKSHYYSGGLSYYNWPYAFGGLFGLGLYAEYQKRGQAFVPLYKALLKATATCSVEDAAALAGIDVTDPAFWRQSLEAVAQEVDQFVALCGK